MNLSVEPIYLSNYSDLLKFPIGFLNALILEARIIFGQHEIFWKYMSSMDYVVMSSIDLQVIRENQNRCQLEKYFENPYDQYVVMFDGFQ